MLDYLKRKPGPHDLHGFNQDFIGFRRGLVGAWLLNDGGLRTHDWSGVGNHGTWDNSDGGMSYVASPYGRVFQHLGDATNDRIDLGSITSANPLSLAGVTTATILWRAFIPSGALSNAALRIIDKSNAAAYQNGWGIDLLESDDKYETTAGTTLANDYYLVFSPVISRSVWQDVAVRVNGNWNALASFSWFIDGVKSAGTLRTTSGVPGASPPSTTTNAAIGNWNHSTDRQWDGKIDYLYVYNRALSDAEVIFLQTVDPYVLFRPALRRSYRVPAAAAGRIMGSLAGHGGLAGPGGLAGERGGLAA